MNGHTGLHQVVSLNESVKAVLWQSHQISVRALDAVVKSSRASATLRGFVEVSSQMRLWSRELDAAIGQVSKASAAQVATMSALLKHERYARLLEAATASASSELVTRMLDSAHAHVAETGASLTRLRRDAKRGLEELQQLGLMASVLSRAALIEATYGPAAEREILSEAARGFAEHAEHVARILRDMLVNQSERIA